MTQKREEVLAGVSRELDTATEELRRKMASGGNGTSIVFISLGAGCLLDLNPSFRQEAFAQVAEALKVPTEAISTVGLSTSTALCVRH